MSERPTDDRGVHVHVGRKTAAPKAAPIAISVVMMIFGAVTFASTYLFATKGDLTEQAIKPVGRLSADVMMLGAKLDAMNEALRGIRIEVRLANRNIDKLLRQRGIAPASLSDVVRDEEME